MRRLCRVLLPLLLVSCMWGSRARADAPSDDERAAAAFEEGAAAFGAGDYVHAADAFERAYSVRPHHDALWNAARARERAGADVHAANLYARYLREAPPDARDRDTAIAALRSLGRRLARIELHVAETVTRARLDGGPFDLVEVWVSPGDHVFEGESTAGPFKKVVRADAGAVLSVTLDADPPPPSDQPVPTAPRSRALPWIAVIAGGAATLALGGVTAWSGLDTVDQKKTFDRTRSQADLEEGRSRMTRTNILLGVTSGVLAITGVVTAALVLTTPNKDARASMSVGVGLGSVHLAGRF